MPSLLTPYDRIFSDTLLSAKQVSLTDRGWRGETQRESETQKPNNEGCVGCELDRQSIWAVKHR